MAKPQKNQIFDLTIDNYSSEGDGIARLDGMAVFVKGALRGERCRVKLLKVGKTAAWGRVEQVVTPSPARIKPDCPHFPKCGGCALRCSQDPRYGRRAARAARRGRFLPNACGNSGC